METWNSSRSVRLPRCSRSIRRRFATTRTGGLVTPERRGGKRMYSREHLRRLAFIQLMQRLGIRLDAASAVLDEPSDQWRDVVREQIAAIDELIAKANGARDFLEHALACPAHPPV